MVRREGRRGKGLHLHESIIEAVITSNNEKAFRAFTNQRSALTLRTSSSLVSTLPPTSPAMAQNLERCLEPESVRTVTIRCPGPSSSAVFTAAKPVLLLDHVYQGNKYITHS